MSIHKLSAGSGYDYLTRLWRPWTRPTRGASGLASYYTERGETAGVWVGSGLHGIDSLAAGNPVTAEQMRHLFGKGRHPLTAELTAQTPDAAGAEQATRLGMPFKSYLGMTAYSGVRLRPASPQSIGLPAGRQGRRCRRGSGHGSGPRWRGSCSAAGTAEIPTMRGSCLGYWRGFPGRPGAVRGHRGGVGRGGA